MFRRLKETTELLEASRDPLTEVRETIANLQVDLEKLRSYSAELDNHAKKMLGKKSETDQELEMHGNSEKANATVKGRIFQYI